MDTGVSGNLAFLMEAVGNSSADFSVLEAMLVLAENPISEAEDDLMCWQFVNSGVDFTFRDGVLDSIRVRLVYDPKSSYNGVTVPSWLAPCWNLRPTSKVLRRTFGDPLLTEPSDERSPRHPAEVFAYGSCGIRAQYDQEGDAAVITLLADATQFLR